MNYAHHFFLASLICSSAGLLGTAKPQFLVTKIDDFNTQIECSIPLAADEYIYADTIDISIDNPAIILSNITLPEAKEHFDPIYKSTKKVFDNNLTISLHITNSSKQIGRESFLRITFYTNKSKTAIEELFALPYNHNAPAPTSSPITYPDHQQEQKAIQPRPQKSPQHEETTQKQESWSTYISGLMQASSSLWLKLLFALLLGLLLSFTPCIYPMIPITMGILQAQAATSIKHNFLLALTYTIGIATTFALMGLTASFAGVLFGSMMTNPIVILFIIALLLYIAFSLFGFYELYMPRSLTNRQLGSSKKGSFLTAFLFGAASGTVASPCLSPGIIFMLTLVATLNNIFLGFLLLFFFGLGLGLPLLIIGTFSGSITLMPRAGAWMDEIKYIFGFMMLGMCIYFLTSLLPHVIITFLLSGLVFSAGCFYLLHTKSWQRGTSKRFYDLLSIMLIAVSVVIAVLGIKTYLLSSTVQKPIHWASDLAIARQEAINQNKALFVFVHATMCIACNEVEHMLETTPAFINAIKNAIAVSLNLSDRTSQIKEFQQTYSILGAPSCLLIDPQHGTVIKRWDGELSNEQLQELISAVS